MNESTTVDVHGAVQVGGRSVLEARDAEQKITFLRDKVPRPKFR